jgi:7-carboxy-7-deazaguanine synthase
VTTLDGATLRVNELFGPTLQGEGPDQGIPALFVRLAGCDLSCSWCDTPYTWDWQRFDRQDETHLTSIGMVVEWAAREAPTLVVVTGGEPMLQGRSLGDLTQLLRSRGKRITVETNGRHLPTTDLQATVFRFVISPKVTPSSGQVDRALRSFEGWLPLIRRWQAAVKLVIADEVDLVAAIDFVKEWDLPPASVWLMPEGRSAGELASKIPWLFEECARLGFNLTSRLHVFAHGDERGH